MFTRLRTVKFQFTIELPLYVAIAIMQECFARFGEFLGILQKGHPKRLQETIGLYHFKGF